MIELRLPEPVGRRAIRILCLGAHCDDIEIGCGGALLALIRRHPSIHVTWVIFSAPVDRERELRASARRFLRGAGRIHIVTHGFRDGFFPAQYGEIKEVFESLKRLPSPDFIFSQHRADLHQDHRVVADLAWNTFRNHLILEYEIPKYEGGLVTPSAYVSLSPAQVETKIRILLACYRSQVGKRWFSADTFRALMRLRGIESGSPSGWAEGFHASKFLLA